MTEDRCNHISLPRDHQERDALFDQFPNDQFSYNELAVTSELVPLESIVTANMAEKVIREF